MNYKRLTIIFLTQEKYIYKVAINKWENGLSGAGRKEAIYATNEELPRQLFNEASVHSITQDCSSNKTKITKQNVFRSPYLEKTAPVPAPPLLWPTKLLPAAVAAAVSFWAGAHTPKCCGLFRFSLYCLISYLPNI